MSNDWKLLGQPASRIVAGSAAIAAGAALTYYIYKKGDSQVDAAPHGDISPLAAANQLKSEGNRLFALQCYLKAGECFQKAINIINDEDLSDPENKRTLAILFNNYSACVDFQGDSEKAIEYATKSIELDDKYSKPYARRSRLYKEKKLFVEACSDLSVVISLSQPKDSTFDKNIVGLLELAELMAVERAVPLFKALNETNVEFLPISQANVADWLWYYSIHDPLIVRMNKVDGSSPKILDKALGYLKKLQYVHALQLGIEAAVDTQGGLLEMALARLLCMRIYYYAGIKKQMLYMIDSFNEIWDHSGLRLLAKLNLEEEEFKGQNIDLLVAYRTFRILIDQPEITENFLLSNRQIFVDNADPYLTAFHFFSRMGLNDKAHRLINMNLENHLLRFYDLNARCAAAGMDKDIGAFHAIAAEFDALIREATDLTEDVALLGSRLFYLMQNPQMALDVLRRNKHNCPKESIAVPLLQMLYSLDLQSTDDNPLHRIKLEELLKKDPNNYEILRLLTQGYLHDADFELAADCAYKSLLNTRAFHEFRAAYNDLIVTNVIAGRPIPYEKLPTYTGPKYAIANSAENVLRFSEASVSN